MIPKRPDGFLKMQLKALSLAVGCLVVYIVLKSTEVKEALGLAYPWYRMIIVTIGLSCLAVSGFEGIRFINLISDIKRHIKNKLNQEDGNVTE